MRAGHTMHVFTFVFMHLYLQKVVEAASTLLCLEHLALEMPPNQSRSTGNMSKFVFSGVDFLMLNNSNNDAADVYKAQCSMEHILIQKMGDTG